MSSQDKPLDSNENLNISSSESSHNSDAIEKKTVTSADLWMEEGEEEELVTEFLSAESIDIDDPVLEEEGDDFFSPPPKKVLSDEDFDNWDFRNPVDVQAENEAVSEPQSLVSESTTNEEIAEVTAEDLEPADHQVKLALEVDEANDNQVDNYETDKIISNSEPELEPVQFDFIEADIQSDKAAASNLDNLDTGEQEESEVDKSASRYESLEDLNADLNTDLNADNSADFDFLNVGDRQSESNFDQIQNDLEVDNSATGSPETHEHLVESNLDTDATTSLEFFDFADEQTEKEQTASNTPESLSLEETLEQHRQNSENNQLDELGEFDSSDTQFAQVEELEEIDFASQIKGQNEATDLDSSDNLELLGFEVSEVDGVNDLNDLSEPELNQEPALGNTDSLSLSSETLAIEDLDGLNESNELDLNLDGADGAYNLTDNLGFSELGASNLDVLNNLESSAEFDLDLGNAAELELSGLEINGLSDLENSASLEELDESNELDLNLENADNFELADLGTEQLGDLGDLELGSPEEADFSDLDGNLDGLLDMGTESESLDSLMLEPMADLDSIESSLESGSKLADLDSMLGEDTAVTPEPQATPRPAKAKISSPVADLSPANKAQTFDQTMRVSVRKLDDLNNLIGELVVKRNRLEDDQERLRRFLDNLLGHVQSLGEAGAKMHDMYERSLLEGALMASRQSRANSTVAAGSSSFINADETPKEEGLDALEMDRFSGFHLVSQDIIELIVRVREAASDIQFVVDETDKVAQTFRQVTGQLQDGMNSSRMVAFGQTADRLPRAIRDISRKQKKETQLFVEGKDVLIDKMIVEHLYNPMTHLVNNAISHGIEKPEERRKRGKPEKGSINIQAFIQGNQTVITVTDDGAGIDPEVVKKKAVEKNLISWASAQNLSNQQVYELLFHPGFSTKDEADDFAGRGVGMDVVNTDLKKIRGSVSTESEVGKGTTFTIRLPLVLSICKALTCVNDNTKIAFPIDGVEDTKEYLPSDIQTNENGVRCISWKNALLPLRPLNTLLNYNRKIRRGGIYNANQDSDDMVSVIVLRSLDNLLAIEVDEVKAEQEIVIKQIDGSIPKPPGIAGATVLGDGTIMPIGDVLELIEIAQGKRTIEISFDILAGEAGKGQAQADIVQQEPMVLVVDDSITVRELLSMSFNKLGYRVEQARDGQEAWDKLRGGLVCDMIFSDIEMPRMNGLELLSNLHKDSGLRSIPVAMLTSRGADKHRQIANDLGAKAYLTKPYTEKDLMDVAQHLIEINRANKEAESATVSLNRANNSQSAEDFADAPLVLIIDDSVTVRELLSMTFKKAGYRVEQARDGQEAWEKLSEGLECDLAFCDIEMPRMNGLELLSQLQKDEKLATLPIAMLTSRGAKKMRNIAASRGANGYFVKPYVEDDLLQAAKRMINGEMLIEGLDED